LLIVEDLTGTPARIQASGGFAQSEFWRQMMADIFGRLVTVPESYESSCLGAAVLGLYALGEVEGIHAVSGMMGTSFTHSPDPGNSDIYRKIMPIYLRLTELYQSEYKAISEFQEKVLESKEPGF
ncbi:MAG TPA: FGGY-family carbohydrate kinase, partial [Bacillaceae bacterium]